MFDERDPRRSLPLVWTLFALFAAGVGLAGYLFDASVGASLRQHLDQRLRVATHLAAEVFPRDLRARVDSGPALDEAEDRVYTELAGRLSQDAGLAYLYALYLDPAGEVRHLWTSDLDQELRAGDGTWFGRAYPDAPPAVAASIAAGSGLSFATYTDSYGDFRGAYLGQTDAAGLTWTVVADLPLAEVQAELAAVRRKVLLAMGLSVLAGLLLAGGLHRLAVRFSRAQRDLRLLAEVAQATGHAVLLADHGGVVRWANGACAHHLGVDSSRAVGQGLAALLQHGAEDAGLVTSLAAVTAGSGVSRELTGPGFPGAAWLLADLRPVLASDGSRWIVCLLRDLSGHRLVEDELRRARQAAEQAVAAKTAFLANMSHEIRTPLNGILGMTGLLLERPLDAASRELVELVHSSGEVLLHILGDILDLTKIEARALRIEPRPCEPATVVREVVRLFQANAAAKGLALAMTAEPPGAPQVLVDALRLRQVVSNLVSNAIKFTDAGRIQVRLAQEPSDGGTCRLLLEVEDSGIGIPAERQGELFQPFVQVDHSLTRRAGGSGLGLAISRRLVDLMGGTIAVRSRPGEGSTFTVLLTVPVASGEAMKPATGQRRGRVLVADGQRTGRTLISLLLRGQGVEDIEQADDAASAIAVAAGGGCALVFLDLDLPGGARPVAAALRAAGGASRNLPIIALARDHGPVPDGYDGCLVRPITGEALRGVLDRWCPVGQG